MASSTTTADLILCNLNSTGANTNLDSPVISLYDALALNHEARLDALTMSSTRRAASEIPTSRAARRVKICSILREGLEAIDAMDGW